MNKSIYIIAIMVLFFTSGCGTQGDDNTIDKLEENQNGKSLIKEEVMHDIRRIAFAVLKEDGR